MIAVTQLAIGQYIAIVRACCRAGSMPVRTGSQGWSVYFDRTEVAQSLARARHVVPDTGAQTFVGAFQSLRALIWPVCTPRKATLTRCASG